MVLRRFLASCRFLPRKAHVGQPVHESISHFQQAQLRATLSAGRRPSRSTVRMCRAEVPTCHITLAAVIATRVNGSQVTTSNRRVFSPVPAGSAVLSRSTEHFARTV